MRMLRIALAWLAFCFPAVAQVGTAAIYVTPPASSGHAMVTPIMVDDNATAPSNSATNYTGLAGNLSYGATITTKQTVIATGGIIANLTVRFPTAVAGGTTYDICLVQNSIGGSSTTCSPLTCQVTSAALTCADASHSVSVSPSDLLSWKVVPTSTPNAQTTIQIGATFTSTANGEGVSLLPVSNTASASAKNYEAFFAGGTWNATEANNSVVMPTAGIFDKLYINSDAAAGAAKSLVYTVFKNGVATAITCTLTGAGSGAGITTCNDTSHSVSVISTDTISLESGPTGTPTVGNVSAAMRWVPTIPGEAVTAQASGGLSTGSTRFQSLNGVTETATETSAFGIAPSVFTIKKMFATITEALSGTQSRTVTLRQGTGSGQASKALTCPLNVTNPSQCSDITNSYTTTLNDLLNTQEVPANTPPANTAYKQSMVVYTP